jgi:hypothetical protein
MHSACGRLGVTELPAKPAADGGARDAAGPVVDAGVTAADGCKPSDVTDYCARLPALPEPPQIDGVLDCGPSLVELPIIGWTGASALPSDQHARYAVAWRPNGLYVYVEVDDPLRFPAGRSREPWCGDGIEIYADSDGVYPSVDTGYDDPGTIQLLAAAPASNPNAARALDERYRAPNQTAAGSWNGMHSMVARDGGFALEAFVTAGDLDLDEWRLEAGAHVGFDVAINVSTDVSDNRSDCEQRLGQYFLHIVSDGCTADACAPYTNANAFCAAELE